MKLTEKELKKFHKKLYNDLKKQGKSTTNTGEIIRKLKKQHQINNQEHLIQIIKKMNQKDYIQSYGMTDWLIKKPK